MFMGWLFFCFFYIAFLALKIEKNQLEVMSAKFMVIKWVTFYKKKFVILKEVHKEKKADNLYNGLQNLCRLNLNMARGFWIR